ncbi:MAG TPA: HPF/RaiA family ribosome-associated protein [Candidatus Sulfotelmatobacter sp.]|nr:HPF/RaiA family ribosome-associated protein [Candidatus Sulfotelmatobacter sp.]HWI59194.1 HPF/RaiA family ribosome-associated protein [Bacillota bacterium]
MKLNIQHVHVPSTNSLDSLVEKRISGLQPRLQIDEAQVRLEHDRQHSPPFRAAVHLVTPGPDVLAEGQDYTIRAAVDKAMARLEDKVQDRAQRGLRRIRSNLQAPASIRTGRGKR